MRKEMLAKDIMRKDVVTVRQSMDAWELARLFTEKGITGAPVVDVDGKVVGVVSQADIVGHLQEVARSPMGEANFYAESENEVAAPRRRAVTAMDLMSPHVIDAPEETPVGKLSQIMLSHRIHRIIITRGKKLLGIVTTMDLLKVI